MRTRNRRIAAAMAALLIAAASFAGCSKKTEETKMQLTRVETQTAARGTLEITGTYIGTVAPHNSVNVTPLVAGTVKKVNVKVGDKVKAGDIIGKCAEDKLCVPVHAPINGTVSTAESNFVVINAD